MRARSIWLCGLLLLLLWPTHAVAQSRAGDVHLFRPALYSGGLFAVDRAAKMRAWQPGVKIFYNFALKPLRLDFPQDKANCPASGCIGRQDIVSSAHVFNLQAQFTLFSRLEIAVDLPIIAHSLNSNPAPDVDEGFELLTKDDPATNVDPPKGGPLDLRVGAKLNVVDTGRFAFAVALDVRLPFGNESVFSGDKGISVHPRLLASLELGRVAVLANAGYRFRERSTILWDDKNTVEGPVPLLQIDDELTFGVGVVARITSLLGVGAEFIGAAPITGGDVDVVEKTTVFAPDPGCPANTPAGAVCEITKTRSVSPARPPVGEVLGGILLTPTPAITIAVGAGAGVLGGIRRVSLRVFAGISWVPGLSESIVGTLDRDKDGVPDAKDCCPEQPEDRDGFQDDDGCPELDNDGDGIPDKTDKCPNKAEDLDRFQDKDGCPDDDNDGDGIPDSRDKCPNKAEDKDKYQDDDGCPELDNDGDGIPDAKDQCPNEPETKNGFQDDDGCPDSGPSVRVGPGKLTISDKIYFKTNKAVLAKKSDRLLNQIAKTIRANPRIGKVRIEGHTDNTGTAGRNQTLSQQRAEAVRRYLIRKGVAPARLQAVGYGAGRPKDTNNTAAGRKNNRRVEFIIVQTKKP